MATRTTSPLAGIRWLRDAINLGARNPGTLVLAAAMVLVCGLIPSLFSAALQFLFPNNQGVFVATMAWRGGAKKASIWAWFMAGIG